MNHEVTTSVSSHTITLKEDSPVVKDNLVLRCGDCLHFKGSAHPAYGEQCVNRGIKTFATAPSCWSPDVRAIKSIGDSTFAYLCSVLSTLTPKQTRIIMGLMKNAGKLERHGFTFLQKVYYLVGPEFLENYHAGYVLGIGAYNTIQVVGSAFLKPTRGTCTAHLLAENVLTRERFIKTRKKLSEAGLMYAPRSPNKAKKSVTIDYEPPTLETPQELLDHIANKSGSQRKVKRSGVLEIELERAE